MYVLTKYGDELALVFSPDETVRLGDTLLVDDIVAQVIDIQFADLPGVLEHILRKSLIARSATEEHVQPERSSVDCDRDCSVDGDRDCIDDDSFRRSHRAHGTPEFNGFELVFHELHAKSRLHRNYSLQ